MPDLGVRAQHGGDRLACRACAPPRLASLPKNHIVLSETPQRKANNEVAKAQLLSAEAMLRSAELNFEWTTGRIRPL